MKGLTIKRSSPRSTGAIRTVLVLAVVGLLSIPATAGAQTIARPEFNRLVSVCKGLVAAAGDLVELSMGIQNPDESRGALDMSAAAQLNAERCNAARGLFVMYALFPKEANRAGADDYLRLRIDIWLKAIEVDITYANRVMGTTKLPGVARQAEALRNGIRSFGEAIKALSPS